MYDSCDFSFIIIYSKQPLKCILIDFMNEKLLRSKVSKIIYKMITMWINILPEKLFKLTEQIFKRILNYTTDYESFEIASI